MSAPELSSELKATIMSNGSGLPLPNDTGWEAGSEKKAEGENSVKTVEVETKEEKKDDDAKMEEMEDEKVAEAEDIKKVEPEDQKIIEPQDAKETKAKDVKMVEAEDGKVAGVEDAKIVESMGAKVEEPEDVMMMDAKAQKDGDKGEEEGEKEVEGEKIGNDVKDEKDGVNQENKVQENNEAKESKTKRVREKKAGEKGDGKEKKESRSKDKKLLSTPLASSTERPVRERKTVERLVELLEREPVKKFLIEKGCGTPLKEIPSVAHKLARKKPADLKLLHQTLFGGRQGKVADFKNHILQFSGFVWHGDEEKQKTKVKEKLDKCVKETLVDLCELFDIPVSKANTRKEELVAKLMDFMVAPHAMTDTVLAEKQLTKLRKRKRVARGSVPKSSEGIPGKSPRGGISKTKDSLESKGKSVHEKEEEEGEEDEENGVPKDNDALKHSESEEIESEEVEDDDDDDYSGKSKHNRKKISKRGASAGTKKSKLVTSPKKAPLLTPAKSPTKSSLRHSKTDDTNDVGAKVLARKKKNVDVPEKKSTPKSDHKEKATGKKVTKGKAKSVAKESAPGKDELRKTICDILKEVDFNTATFTDILKELAERYSMDLTPRKKSIKLMIQEELTLLADEAEEDGAANEDGKPATVCKGVEA